MLGLIPVQNKVLRKHPLVRGPFCAGSFPMRGPGILELLAQEMKPGCIQGAGDVGGNAEKREISSRFR